MIELFSSRELATGIWTLAIITFVFASKKMRRSAFGVIKATLPLALPFIYMVVYAGGITALFTKFPIWEWFYLKEIIIWVLFAKQFLETKKPLGILLGTRMKCARYA